MEDDFLNDMRDRHNRALNFEEMVRADIEQIKFWVSGVEQRQQIHASELYNAIDGINGRIEEIKHRQALQSTELSELRKQLLIVVEWLNDGGKK